MNIGHEYLSLKLFTLFVLVASFFSCFGLIYLFWSPEIQLEMSPDFYKCCSELWTSSQQHFSPLTYLRFAEMLTRRHFIPGTRLPPLMERLDCVFSECVWAHAAQCVYMFWSPDPASPWGRQLRRCHVGDNIDAYSLPENACRRLMLRGEKGEWGCKGFAAVLTRDLMISRPAPTPCHAFSQQWGKWQGDIIMWHSVWRGVSEGILPHPPTILALS